MSKPTLYDHLGRAVVEFKESLGYCGITSFTTDSTEPDAKFVFSLHDCNLKPARTLRIVAKPLASTQMIATVALLALPDVALALFVANEINRSHTAPGSAHVTTSGLLVFRYLVPVVKHHPEHSGNCAKSMCASFRLMCDVVSKHSRTAKQVEGEE